MDRELLEPATIRNFRIVQTEGTRQVGRDVKHYNLQMIIAVGFKVNNERAIQFRRWANSIVKDYTIQGWVMDDERLKNGGSRLTNDYFEKQLGKREVLHPMNKGGAPIFLPFFILLRSGNQFIKVALIQTILNDAILLKLAFRKCFRDGGGHLPFVL